MDERKLELYFEYLRILSLLKSTRVNEQNRVIAAIERELGLEK